MYEFFNQHFKLGLEKPVLEADFELLSQEQMTVWNENHPAPTGINIGDPHEITLLKMATEDSEENLAALIPNTADELEEYRMIVGGAWDTILGRRLDQVGEVTFSKTKTMKIDGFDLLLGRLDHVTASEQLPAMQLNRAGGDSKQGVVVWVTETGKAGVLDGNKVVAPVSELLNKGYTVVTADLSGQGEFLSEDKPLTSQRMWYQRKATNAWERFSGYTYGYNHSLFVKRTHDVLTLIKYAQSLPNGKTIRLKGEGKIVGPLVLAARSQAGDTIDAAEADLKGFQFQKLTKHDDPMFVPGAVKYFDVQGLVSLCAPHQLTVSGLEDSTVAERVYATADAKERLEVVADVNVRRK